MRPVKPFQFKKNATDLGGNLTENAKNMVANIGEEIENLTK